MSEIDDAAASMAADAGDEAVAPDAPAAPVDNKVVEDTETGGTTPEEVAAVLKDSGMDVKTPVKAEDDKDESEEVDESADKTDAKPGKSDVKEQPKAPEAPAKPTEVVEAPDFTLEVEDADGVTHKMASIEDLPEDFTPKNNRQIIEILKDLSKVESDKSRYEDEQKSAQAEADNAQAIATIQEGWDKEIASLVADKSIPANDKTRTDAIYKYMGEQNDERAKAGRPLIASIEDAYNGLVRKEAAEAEVTKAKEAKETARRNGGLVGGSSAPASSGPPVYKAGSARNSNEALKVLGLI